MYVIVEKPELEDKFLIFDVSEEIPDYPQVVKTTRHFHDALKYIENHPFAKGFETWTPGFIFNSGIIKFAS